jgi:hypothetical protein
VSQQERTYFEHTLAAQLIDYVIWGTLTWRPRCSNHSRIHSAQTVTYVTGTLRNPCLRAGPLSGLDLGVMARPVRFELTTPCSGGMYSIHLSYGRAVSTH